MQWRQRVPGDEDDENGDEVGDDDDEGRGRWEMRITRVRGEVGNEDQEGGGGRGTQSTHHQHSSQR